MSIKNSNTHRLFASVLFAVIGVLVTVLLSSKALRVLEEASPTANFNLTSKFEPEITIFLLKEIMNHSDLLWPALALFVLGCIASLFGARFIYLTSYLSYLDKQNLELDEALRETQKKWRHSDLTNKDLHQQISSIHERISDCFIFVSFNGEVLHANTKASQFFERNFKLQQKLIGTQLSLFLPGYQETELGTTLEATQNNNRPVKAELEISRHIWIQASFYPTTNGIFIYFEDVSRQKSAKVKVETSVSLLRQILDSALQPSAITDKNWNYVATNKQWLNQFKLDNDEILGHFFGQVLPDAIKNLKEVGQQVCQGDVYKTEEQPLKIGNSEEWIIWEVHPWWDDDGTHGGFIILATFTTELRRRREQAARHREKERKLAYYDNLTGLPNRQLFYDRLNQYLANAYKSEITVALMFLDLDGFKAVNDEIGHDAGDALLREVAQRLQDAVRGTDTVARLGGDEFTIVLNDIKDIDNVQQISQKIISSISKPYYLASGEARVTTSVGVSLYPEHGSTAVELIKLADTAMYKAKNSGKNQYYIYQEEEINIFPQDDQEIAKILTNALENKEFELHYQPQTEGVDGQVVGIEALLRWRHPQHGVLDPVDFLPQAESTGKIIEIGKWTLEEACRQNLEWRKEGLGDYIITVNISSLQFREAGFVEAVDQALEKAALPADSLGIEISEMLMNEYPQTTLETINALKLKGVRILVDDFGVRKSSPQNLSNFPIDTIKIHQSLVRSIDESSENKSIIKNIISLASDLGLNIIGEGVENVDQAEFLTHNGCNYIQGFLSGRPIMPTSTAEFLLSKNEAIKG